MKIENTELEYSQEEEIILDYWLSEENESKDQWAQRVWNLCKEYKDTNGKGYIESDYGIKGMPTVYATSPYFLWENKKRRRRAAIIEEFTGIKCCPKLLEAKNIEDDLKNGLECKWGNNHNDAKIMELKTDPKYNYKTATEKYREKIKEEEEQIAKLDLEVQAKVEKLRSKNFDDETIEVIYPASKSFFFKNASV